MTFSEALMLARKRAKLTQRELAERVNVTSSHLSWIERGTTPGGKDLHARLVAALPEIETLLQSP